jgi:hypothetical protein
MSTLLSVDDLVRLELFRLPAAGKPCPCGKWCFRPFQGAEGSPEDGRRKVGTQGALFSVVGLVAGQVSLLKPSLSVGLTTVHGLDARV